MVRKPEDSRMGRLMRTTVLPHHPTNTLQVLSKGGAFLGQQIAAKPSKSGSDVGRAAAQALVAVAANMQGSIASAAEAYGVNARKVSKARKMLAAPSEAGGGLVPHPGGGFVPDL